MTGYCSIVSTAIETIAQRSIKFYFLRFLVSITTLGAIFVYVLDNCKLKSYSLRIQNQYTPNRSNNDKKLYITITGPLDERYLEANLGSIGGGRLGNQMFLFVSTFGVAKTLNRTAFIAYFETETVFAFASLVKIFPNLADAYRILLVSRKEIKPAGIGSGRCCSYDDLEKYHKFDNDRYIAEGGHGTYLQSYKYFNSYRNQLLNYYLLFDQSYIDKANKLLEEFAIAVDDLKQRHTICVHNRRRDFALGPQYPSPTAEQVRKMVQFVLNHNDIDRISNVIVFLIGDDYLFQNSIFDSKLDNITAYTLPIDDDQPAMHLAFAVQHCKSIIITASRSTFGWWMAYMSLTASVYYIFDNQKPEQEWNNKTGTVRGDYFLPEWIPIQLNK